MGTQMVVSTKHYHTMQLATESKAVENEISDHEMENDSPEYKRPNFDHRLRTVIRLMPVLERNISNIAT